MNKELIKSRFKKHLASYEKNAVVQKIMAEKLVNLCSGKYYKRILELGCGTGTLTKLANSLLEFDSYVAIDIVDECESFLKAINPKISFKSCDIESFELNEYDLIISNAALQWVDNFDNTVNKIISAINSPGEFIFSTVGKENLREIYNIVGIGLNYCSETELKEKFPAISECLQEIYVMSFDSPKEVLEHLRYTGVNAIENRPWTKADLTAFENAYNALCIAKPTLTYNPVYIKIVK